MSTPTFFLSTPVENSEATRNKTIKCNKPYFLQDNHEICFVGAEGFDDLSQVDPKGDALLEEALEADKSKEWYEKKKRSKDEAK